MIFFLRIFVQCTPIVLVPRRCPVKVAGRYPLFNECWPWPLKGHHSPATHLPIHTASQPQPSQRLSGADVRLFLHEPACTLSPWQFNFHIRCWNSPVNFSRSSSTAMPTHLRISPFQIRILSIPPPFLPFAMIRGETKSCFQISPFDY